MVPAGSHRMGCHLREVRADAEKAGAGVSPQKRLDAKGACGNLYGKNAGSATLVGEGPGQSCCKLVPGDVLPACFATLGVFVEVLLHRWIYVEL